jgi:hypothetical protein
MPLPLYPRRKAPGTHWIGNWVDPRAGLDDLEKTLPELELRPLVIQPVASRYTDYVIPASYFLKVPDLIFNWKLKV